MQKFRICFFIAACLCLSQQTVFAEETPDTSTHHPVEEADNSLSQSEPDTTVVNDTSSTAKDILSELIIRPIAVLGSATGLALFVIASPISGLASIPEPHDVFKTTWDDFVVTPYHFAFRRPFGDYSVELN